MTKAANTSGIEKATNKSWEKWINELDKIGGRNLSHADLALKINKILEGKIKSHSWWAQTITVAYEQHIGKRIPGQLANGLFEIAVSKTINAARSDVFKQVVSWSESHKVLNDSKYVNPRQTETPKRSNWRCDFEDGSKFSATVEGDNNKAKLVLAHTAIPGEAEADVWKEYWRETADMIVIIIEKGSE